MIVNIFLAMMILFSGSTVPVTTDSLPQCATEESTNCFWDASEQGNGEGKDFHDIDGIAYYECVADEDEANCFWDATKQGNGEGRSFTDVDGVAIWWDEIAAWQAWDASNAADQLTEGGKVEYAGLYSGQQLENNQWIVEGFVFTVSSL